MPKGCPPSLLPGEKHISHKRIGILTELQVSGDIRWDGGQCRSSTDSKIWFHGGGGGGSSRMIPASGFVHNAHFLLMISASSGI